MIRTLLFLCTLLLLSTGYSQYYEDLNSYCNVEAFHDYKQCYQGIRTTNGEVLIEAQFTQVQLLPRNMILVQKDGYYGVLGCDMKYIIQPKYESLELWGHSDMHQMIGKSYWKAQLNGKFGVIDSLQNVIVPFEFSMINLTYPAQQSLLYDNGHYSRELSNYQDVMRFIVEKDNKIGAFDLQGAEVFEAIYDRIEYKRMRSNLPTSLEDNLYWVTKKGNEFSVHDLQNKTLFSDSTCSDIFLHPLLVKEGKDAEIIVYLQQDKKYLWQLYNITTGDRTSEGYCNPVITGSLIYCVFYSDELGAYGGILDHRLTKVQDIVGQYQWLTQFSETTDRYLLTTASDFSTILDGNGATVIKFEKGYSGITGQGENTLFWQLIRSKDLTKYILSIYTADGKLSNEIDCEDVRFDVFYNEDKPLEYPDYTKTFITHQRLAFIKKKNKWGAIDHTGRVKVDFIYDNFIGAENFPLPTSQQVYKLKKNGKVGLIDSLGKIVLPFAYDEIISGFSDSLSLLKHDGKYTVINEKEKVLFSNAQEVFMPNTRSYLNSFSRPRRFNDLMTDVSDSLKFQAFAVRNDTLYSLKNGVFIKCDKNYVRFENETSLVENRILRPSGSYEALMPKTRSFSGPHFYLRLFEDSTAILSFSGAVINRIESISAYEIRGDYLKIKLEDGRMGILAKDGKSWAIPPNYYEIIMPNETPDKAWVKTTPVLLSRPFDPIDPRPTYDGGWTLIDQKGNKLIKDGLLNEPAVALKPSYSRLRSYGIYTVDTKYGLLDTMNNVLLGAQYDWIVPTSIPNVFLLYRDSSCVLFNSNDLSTSAIFDDAYSVAYNGIIPVYKTMDGNLMIGFINTNKNLAKEIDWKPQAEVIENESLEKLFSVGNYAREDNLRLEHYLAIVPENLDVFRKQNNDRLLQYWSSSLLTSEMAFQSCYPLNYLFPLPKDSEPDYDYARKEENTSLCVRIDNPFFKRHESYKRMQTVYTSTWFHSISIYKDNGHFGDVNIQYETYLVDQPTEVLSFYSLFKNEEKIKAFLEEYTLNYFNENQVLRDVCPDVASLLNLMTHNFCLTDKGILFYSFKYYTFTIPYSELSSYLKKEIKTKVKEMEEKGSDKLK